MRTNLPLSEEEAKHHAETPDELESLRRYLRPIVWDPAKEVAALLKRDKKSESTRRM